MKIEKLSPAFKDYLWGGTKLRDVYGKKCDYEKVAESWELSTHPAGQSVIDGGEYDGLKFGEYLEKVGAKALGVNGAKFKEFPVLIKFIDAKQPLSVQVHPSDEYALRVEGEYGKTEMWYLLPSDADATLLCGLKQQITPTQYAEMVENDTICDAISRYDVKEGDCFFLPAGRIHAIGTGCFLAEIQQTSDVTYRIYDFKRKDKDGNFIWPGYGDNMRVLDWILRRAKGKAEGQKTVLGVSPTYAELDKTGLDYSEEQFNANMALNPSEWQAELESQTELFDKVGKKLPVELEEQRQLLIKSFS